MVVLCVQFEFDPRLDHHLKFIRIQVFYLINHMIVYDYVIFFRLGKFITTPGLLGPVSQKFYLTKRKNNIIMIKIE